MVDELDVLGLVVLEVADAGGFDELVGLEPPVLTDPHAESTSESERSDGGQDRSGTGPR